MKIPLELNTQGHIKETERTPPPISGHKAYTYLSCFGEGLGDLAVAYAVAGGDEIGHAAALQEGGGGDGPVSAEHLGEGDHLHQPQADDCSLGVVSETQAVAEACAHRHDVLTVHTSVKQGS